MSSVWRSLILALAVALALAAVALLVLTRWVLPRPFPDTTGDTAQYVIGQWQGQVAVFEGKQTFPKQVFDVYVDTLPTEAKQRVLDGIPVNSTAQLSVLLEDYTG